MAYGDLYQVGTATLDGGDASLVEIAGALLLANAVAGDTFEYAGRGVTIAEVIDNENLRFAYDWPDSSFENVAYAIVQDAPSRNPPIALARTLRDQIDRLRIFNYSKPIFGIKEFGVNTPPVDYATDDMLVIGSSPTGDFSGHVNKVARYTEEGSWFIQSPEYGWHVIAEVDPNGVNLVRTWDGSSWELTAGLAAGIQFIGAWDNAEDYTAGNVVSHNFKLWISIAEGTNEEPGTAPDYWIEYPVPGEHGGVPIALAFDTDTTGSEPASGGVKLNNATPGSATVLRISKTDLYGGNRAAEIAWIGTSNTSGQKGRIRLQKIGSVEDFRAIVMTVTDAGTSYNLSISSPSAPNGFFDDDDPVLFYFDWRGDVGLTGATGAGYKGTSATSLTVGATSPISFTATTGLAYAVGARYRLGKSDDVGVYLEGECTSYDPVTGAFTGTVDNYRGSGSVNSWTLNLSGLPGFGLRGTSTTSLAVEIAEKSLTTQPRLAYAPGLRVRLASASAWMEGPVTSYNFSTGALVVEVDKILNSGTYADWVIGAAGEPGVAVDGVDGASALMRVRVVDVVEGDPDTGYEAGDEIDGITLAENDVVLRASPGGDVDDGVYVVPASGAALRHTGFDIYNDFPAAEFNVMEGDDYAATKWRCISPTGGTLGSTAVEIIQSLSMDGSNNLSELTDGAAARANIGALSEIDVRRNRIVNPCMQISQENDTTAGTTSGYFAADQFSNSSQLGGTGTFTFGRVASVSPAGSPYRLRVTVTAAQASLAAADRFNIFHLLEGSTVADFLFGSASAKAGVIRLGVKAPAGLYSVAIINSAGNRSFVSSFTIGGGEANTDVVKEVAFTGDTSGTWATGDVLGWRLVIVLAGGTDYLASAGWQSTSSSLARMLTGQKNLFDTNSAVFELFDVGLKMDAGAFGEYGVFEVPNPSAVIRDCQRYWVKVGTAGGIIVRLLNYSAGSNYVTYALPLPVKLRTGSPTLTAQGDINDGSNFTSWDSLYATDNQYINLVKNGIASLSYVDIQYVQANARM